MDSGKGGRLSVTSGMIIKTMEETQAMDDKNQESLDGLREAMNLEVEGMNFFQRASELTRDPKGKDTFLRLVKVELGHYKILEAEYNSLRQTGRWLSYQEVQQAWMKKGDISDIFAQEGFLKQLQDDTTDLEAIKMAIELEKKAGKHFQEAARRAQDPLAVEVFQKLAEEEEKHLKLFEAEYDYVSRSGFYFDDREFSTEY